MILHIFKKAEQEKNNAQRDKMIFNIKSVYL